MATFNMGSAGDISLIDDIPKVQAYLYRLEKQLKYMFANLEPDENYTESARLMYVANADKQAKLEISLDQISLSMVTKDTVVSAINLSEEGVKIQGERLSLEGVTTFNNNVTIGLDGTIHANNGVFQGDISASNISGSTVNGSTINVGGSGTAGSIIVKDASDNSLGQWTKDGISIKKGSIEGTSITVKDTGGNTIGSFNSSGITIKNGTINAPSITGGTLSGSTINVGGSGVAGAINVKDSSGNVLGTFSPSGITIKNGSINAPTITGGTLNGSTINVGGNGVAGAINVKDSSGNVLGTFAPGGITIKNGAINAPTITGGTLNGSTINVGGNGVAGVINIKDGSGNTLGTLAPSGISIKGSITGSTISGGTISGAAISGGTISGGAISGGTVSGTAISGGTITGGAISGGTITGTTFNSETFNGGTFNGSVSFNCGDYFSIENVTDSRDYMFTLGNFQFGYDNNLRDHFFGSTGGMSDFEVTAGGDLYVNEIYPRNSWWQGQHGWWSLTEVCEALWDEIYDSGGILDRLDDLEGA